MYLYCNWNAVSYSNNELDDSNPPRYRIRLENFVKSY